MSRSIIFLTLTACSLLCFGGVLSQDLYDCLSAPGQSLNLTIFRGKWYQVSRNPGDVSLACVEVDFQLKSAVNAFQANVSHAIIANHQYRNETLQSDNVPFVENDNGYVIRFTKQNTIQAPVYIKILALYRYTETGTIYAAGCGFLQADSPESAYAFLLSDKRNVPRSEITLVNYKAAQNFSDFDAYYYWPIQQMGCYKDSAVTVVPMMIGIIAMVYALLNVA